MKSSQLTIYRTALMMQGMIHLSFEKIEKGETVNLKRLEEILRLFLSLMNRVQDSPSIDIDSIVETVLSGCGERRGNLKVLYPRKKRLFLGAEEASRSTNRAG